MSLTLVLAAGSPLFEPWKPLSASEWAPGSLVSIIMEGTVGVVLDEIPKELREPIAASYLDKPREFWKARAEMQIEHTLYRLTYRSFFYNRPKGALPLPPKALWSVALDAGGARRATFQGHDAVLIAYELSTTILTDRDSPGIAESRLSAVGGTWSERFALPLDPEFLLQRTGFACIDEDGFPPNTADSENARFLFDQDCTVETPRTASCHLTEPLPSESCRAALKRHVGRVDTRMRFERLPWNAGLADRIRIGTPHPEATPDLRVIGEALEDNRVIYRYIPPDSCAIAEACVQGPGWRRLLQFTASIQNLGARPLVVGSTDEASPLTEHNVFESSACHEHYHFRYYGDFLLGDGNGATLQGDKRAFCVEPTQRHFNAETSPLVHPYSCDEQGLEAGWGDDYMAGIECQWIDITDLEIPKKGKTYRLSFEVNPEAFLCEGHPVVDEEGNPVFEPTDFVTEDGEPVDRPLCDFAANWDDNNKESRRVRLTREGSFVTESCTRSQAGPLRDCGFIEQHGAIACSPGDEVSLDLTTGRGAPPQVVRFCETSRVLGTGVACTYSDSLANAIVTGGTDPVTFACPQARDAREPGGQFSVYVAPLSPEDRVTPIRWNRANSL